MPLYREPVLLLAFASFILLSCSLWHLCNSENVELSAFWRISSPPMTGKPNNLGLNASVYLISLRARKDRRRDMETLRSFMNISWTVVDALSMNSGLVQDISHQLRAHRSNSALASSGLVDSTPLAKFWPQNFNAIARSPAEIALNSASFWSAETPGSLDHGDEPLTCAQENDVIPPYAPTLREHMILTPSRIACWHSHLIAIHHIAHRNNSVSVILEDDVDMERDIELRLASLWPYLPKDWHILYLGHCWSDESLHPPLDPFPMDSFSTQHIHPSNAPKCTHAYALSALGARRLLLHLNHPPFAYSRAIDQAMAWLVASGRLKSYSVVPSLVVQRKQGKSDVANSGEGSAWREGLNNGVFGYE